MLLIFAAELLTGERPMQANEASTEIMIIGAGPIGLFAALQSDKKLRFQYTTSAPAPRILLRAA